MPYKDKEKRKEYMRKYRAKGKVSVNPVNPKPENLTSLPYLHKERLFFLISFSLLQ